jgi:flagellar basal-body rod modification protein FlgD
MQVNGISSTSQITANSTANQARATGSNALDSSQFMEILMAQLTHQNPLEPMNNAEMMSQFSQLNSLQELRDIHTAMDKVSASNQVMYMASLIGKTVKVNRPDGNVLEGVVSEVITEKDNPQLKIGNEKVSVSDVIDVKGENV